MKTVIHTFLITIFLIVLMAFLLIGCDNTSDSSTINCDNISDSSTINEDTQEWTSSDINEDTQEWTSSDDIPYWYVTVYNGYGWWHYAFPRYDYE